MHNRFAVSKICSWTILNSFYVDKKNPAEFRGIFCSKAKRLIFVFFDRRLRFLLTLVRIERDLAEAESHRGHFDAFVIIDERDAFFEGHAAVRRELNVVVGSLGTHVRQVLTLRRIHDDIGCTVVFADDHARIDFGCRRNEECAAVFELGESVACGCTRFLRNENAVRTCRNVALVRFEADTTSLKAPCFAALLKSGHSFLGSPLV